MPPMSPDGPGRREFIDACDRQIQAAAAVMERTAQAMYAPNYDLQAVAAERMAAMQMAGRDEEIRRRAAELEAKLTELAQQATLRELIYRPKVGRPRPRQVRMIDNIAVIQVSWGEGEGARAEQWLRRHGWERSVNTGRWMKGEPYVDVP